MRGDRLAQPATGARDQDRLAREVCHQAIPNSFRDVMAVHIFVDAEQLAVAGREAPRRSGCCRCGRQTARPSPTDSTPTISPSRKQRPDGGLGIAILEGAADGSEKIVDDLPTLVDARARNIANHRLPHRLVGEKGRPTASRDRRSTAPRRNRGAVCSLAFLAVTLIYPSPSSSSSRKRGSRFFLLPRAQAGFPLSRE